MWVKFTSQVVTVRGARRGLRAAVEWIAPVKDFVGYLNGPVFNDISVNYDVWNVNTEGTSARLYWGAATVNNALYEFYDYAANDGITPPPINLDVYAGVGEHTMEDAFALMSAQYSLSLLLAANLAAAVGLSPISNFLAPIAGVFGWVGAMAYLPDVQIGIERNRSDRLKYTAYHEYAHASHFTNVGPVYWEILAYSEIIAGGHGTENSVNAPLIAVSESWADFIGMTYAHRQYGASNSLGILISYLNWLETSKNESENHVPVGFFHDLVGGINNEVGCDKDQFGRCPPTGGGVCCGPINDQVTGFTISQMFDLMDFGTNSPSAFRNRLIQGQSTAIQTSINDLFNGY